MPVTIGGLKLFSVDDLAAKLNVTKLTIRTYCREGRLRARKVGNRWFVSEESLREYFNAPSADMAKKGKSRGHGSLWD